MKTRVHPKWPWYENSRQWIPKGITALRTVIENEILGGFRERQQNNNSTKRGHFIHSQSRDY